MAQVSVETMSSSSIREVLETLGGMQDNQRVLREAIHDTLLSLGGPIAETIIWQLRARGILLDSHIDAHQFYETLGEAVGVGADMVMTDVFENMMRRIEETVSPMSDHRISRKQFEDTMSSLGKQGKKAVLDDLKSRGTNNDRNYFKLADVCDSLDRYFDANSPEIAMSKVWTKVDTLCSEGALMQPNRVTLA